MVAVEIIYLAAPAHGNFLAAKGVVFGDGTDGERAALDPRAGVASLVFDPNAEGVVGIGTTAEGASGLVGGG